MDWFLYDNGFRHKGSNDFMLSGIIAPLGIKRLFNGSIRSISTSE